MGRGKSVAALTPRQREWLEHLRACARQGETVRAYAKRLRLSEQALYQASKELRRKGVLPAPKRASKKRAAKGTGSVERRRFVEVAAAPAAREPEAAWRARLPNGVVIEGTWGLGDVVEALSRL